MPTNHGLNLKSGHNQQAGLVYPNSQCQTNPGQDEPPGVPVQVMCGPNVGCST